MSTMEEKHRLLLDLQDRIDYFCFHTKSVDSDDSVINAYDLMVELQESVKDQQGEGFKRLNVSQEVGEGLVKAIITLSDGKVSGSIGFQSKRDTLIASSDRLRRIYERFENDKEFYMKRCSIEREHVNDFFKKLLPDDFVERNGIQK